ncbi:class I SAM-dependent methyltransferase [Actinomadura scrupuli]|uniref:class I SAM-dependent methyltransferase n=1 Tax=Actinomadura scrupuli TaxID=559629 RepID=UPI003D9677C2
MARDAHPLFARYYARASLTMERGIAGHRRTLLAGLSGRVIEVGAGNGLNFAHYPPEVTGVLAVEPEPHLRRIARENAEHAPVPVEVVDGTAGHLPVDDQSCDAAIASLVLCTVPDPGQALAEVWRVLKPGGQLRFFEHVRSPSTALHRIQRLLDATVWPTLGGGCHTGRDTEAAITNAGFVIERLDRLSSAATQIPFPASPQILGIAVRPGGPPS